MTKKGLLTKRRIIDAAKAIFRKNGSEKSALCDICQISNAQLGTLTYYFPKKTDIIATIYEEYEDNIRSYIQTRAGKVTEEERYFYFLLIFYYQIYRDEQCRSFHHELLQVFEINEDSYQSHLPPFINRNRPNFKVYIYADTAIRRSFNLLFYKRGEFSIKSVKQLIRDLHIVNLNLYQISEETIDSCLNKAEEFLLADIDCNIFLL